MELDSRDTSLRAAATPLRMTAGGDSDDSRCVIPITLVGGTDESWWGSSGEHERRKHQPYPCHPDRSAAKWRDLVSRCLSSRVRAPALVKGHYLALTPQGILTNVHSENALQRICRCQHTKGPSTAWLLRSCRDPFSLRGLLVVSDDLV